MKPAKEILISQRGNFSKTMVNKIHMKNILQHLSKTDGNETCNKNHFENYEVDNRDVLESKLRNCVTIPFILTNDNKWFFIFKHCSTSGFKFNDLIDIQLGWFYFNITIISSVQYPLRKLEYSKTAINFILLPTV